MFRYSYAKDLAEDLFFAWAKAVAIIAAALVSIVCVMAPFVGLGYALAYFIN